MSQLSSATPALSQTLTSNEVASGAARKLFDVLSPVPTPTIQAPAPQMSAPVEVKKPIEIAPKKPVAVKRAPEPVKLLPTPENAPVDDPVTPQSELQQDSIPVVQAAPMIPTIIKDPVVAGHVEALSNLWHSCEDTLDKCKVVTQDAEHMTAQYQESYVNLSNELTDTQVKYSRERTSTIVLFLLTSFFAGLAVSQINHQ